MSKEKRSFKSSLQVLPKERIRHVAFFLIAIVLCLSTIGIIIIKQVDNLMQLLVEYQGDEAMIQSQSLTTLSLLFVILVVMLLGYSIYNFLLMKRLYGSLFSMERYAQKNLDGDYTGPLRYREDDETKKLVELLSKMAEKINQKK